MICLLSFPTFSYDENRCRLKKTLFCIHRSVAHILELWNTKYKEITLVDARELSKVTTPFELFEFAVSP